MAFWSAKHSLSKANALKGIIEQIDGVIEIDGELFLVEVKWWNVPLGTNEVAPHLVRLFGRGSQAKGIFISYTDFSLVPAISTFRDALAGGAVVVCCRLKELVTILEQSDQHADLKAILKNKIRAAILDKEPWREYVG